MFSVGWRFLPHVFRLSPQHPSAGRVVFNVHFRFSCRYHLLSLGVAARSSISSRYKALSAWGVEWDRGRIVVS